MNERKLMSEVDLVEAEQFLQELLPRAGERLRIHFEKRDFTQTQKEGVDFTTEADVEIDEFLRESIRAKYQDHDFLTEETAPDLSDEIDISELKEVQNLWVIDPLDGTINFSRGIGHFAISVALLQRGETVLGAIYAPVEDKFYFASKDKDGAYLNGRQVHVSKTKDLREVVLGCDWGWDLKKRSNIVEWLDKVADQVRQVASRGSAVADLASLAEGRIDVYFHSGLKPWDTAAAMLIIQKAGGQVSNVDGSDYSPFDKEILATNGKLHRKIKDLLGPKPIKY